MTIFPSLFHPADWLLFLAYYWKSQEGPVEAENVTAKHEDVSAERADLAWNDIIMNFLSVRFAGLYPYYLVPAFFVSYLFFFGIGGFLHVSPTDHPSGCKTMLYVKDSIEFPAHLHFDGHGAFGVQVIPAPKSLP